MISFDWVVGRESMRSVYVFFLLGLRGRRVRPAMRCTCLLHTHSGSVAERLSSMATCVTHTTQTSSTAHIPSLLLGALCAGFFGSSSTPRRPFDPSGPSSSLLSLHKCIRSAQPGPSTMIVSIFHHAITSTPSSIRRVTIPAATY